MKTALLVIDMQNVIPTCSENRFLIKNHKNVGFPVDKSVYVHKNIE